MTNAAAETLPLTGAWQLDATHSTVAFAVKYMGVTTFRSEFKDVAASLEVAEDGSAKLVGTVQAESVDIDNAFFKSQVTGDEFFAIDKHPEITFTSSSLTIRGGAVVVAGDLTIRGATQPVEGRGELSGPMDDGMGNARLAVAVEAGVDRTAFGLNWNSPLPSGGLALANDVRLILDLFFLKG